MFRITLWTYRVLLVPIGLILFLMIPFVTKLRVGLKERIGLNTRIRRLGLHSPIWFHFSSAGEFEQALGVIDAFRQSQPKACIFISYFSPSARGAIERETKRRGGRVPWDGSDYSPIDKWLSVRTFLSILKPNRIVIINRELWPELIQGALTHRIPIALIATYIQKPPSWITSALYSQFDWIGTVDESTEKWLSEAGVKNVATIGDPRHMRILERIQAPIPWKDFFVNRRCFVFGSLWPEDFKALEPAIRILAARGWCLILVPHEADNDFVLQLLNFTKSLGASRLWSNFLRQPDYESHLVVDSMGYLIDLYAVATVAFVGGSFKRRVHNVAEPLSRRIPVFTGPFSQNCAEAVELSKTVAVTSLEQGKDLPIALDNALAQLAEVQRTIDSFFNRQRQVCENYVKSLQAISS